MCPLRRKENHDLDKLRRIQLELAAKVQMEDRVNEESIKTITGFDLAYLDDAAIASAVTLNYETGQILESKAIRVKTSFPYIPTFLCFREGLIILKLFKKLHVQSDVLMLDSHGISHPYYCGCASYVGVLLDKPTMGIAKNRLCGEYAHMPNDVMEWVPLDHQGRTVGAVMLSKQGCKPIFVSVGHMMTLMSAIRVVKHVLRGYKIPEPIRLADQLAKQVKRESSVSER